jgi:hypothetical protein
MGMGAARTATAHGICTHQTDTAPAGDEGPRSLSRQHAFMCHTRRPSSPAGPARTTADIARPTPPHMSTITVPTPRGGPAGRPDARPYGGAETRQLASERATSAGRLSRAHGGVHIMSCQVRSSSTSQPRMEGHECMCLPRRLLGRLVLNYWRSSSVVCDLPRTP